MGQTVTRTPEYSLAQILRPFDGFEQKYQGDDTEVNPIAVPGKLDARAGQAGYDPNLMAGAPVPMGANIKLWLPRLQSPAAYGATPEDPPQYIYSLVWRIRSLTEASQDAERRLSAHFGRLLKGVPQVDSPIQQVSSGGDRFVIPAAIQTVQWHNNDIVSLAGAAGSGYDNDSNTIPKGSQYIQRVDGAEIDPPGYTNPEPAEVRVNSANFKVNPPTDWFAPYSPTYTGNDTAGQAPKFGNAGLISQGYYADANGTAVPGGTDPKPHNTQATRRAGQKSGPIYDIVSTQAEGDELLILISRNRKRRPDAADTQPWDFTDYDAGLSAILGNGTGKAYENLGVYLFTGSGT